MSSNKVLKQGETLAFGAGNKYGLNENVTYSSSNPSLVSVSNSGVVSVVGNPTKIERVAVFAKDNLGVPVGSATIYVVPSAANKNDTFKVASSANTDRFLKVTETSQFTVNTGAGPHVGVTYESTKPSLVTVSSTGLVTCISDVAVADHVSIIAKDTAGEILNAVSIVVLPSGASEEKLSVKPIISVTLNESA